MFVHDRCLPQFLQQGEISEVALRSDGNFFYRTAEEFFHFAPSCGQDRALV
jgi:hypothetical protein